MTCYVGGRMSGGLSGSWYHPPLSRIKKGRKRGGEGATPKDFLLYMNKMERTYTPAEIAEALATLERMKQSHRESQHRYYERNANAKKAYAAAHYRRKKAEREAAAVSGSPAV